MSVNFTAKPSDLFTCVTCNIAFNNADLQRDHYKTDWHRYNLKRKVAELPPIDHSDFVSRVQMQQAQVESAQNQVPEETFCKLCSKHFTSINSFTNHKQSKKHKDLEAAALSSSTISVPSENVKMPQLSDEQFAIKSDRAAKKAVQMEEYLKKQQELEAEIEEVDEEDKDWEDIREEELNECDESTGINVKTCFFCTYSGETVEDKCEHMAKVHSFFIPDIEHVSDLEGLVKFLGVKMGSYHVCLWCSSKCYRDLMSVQKHMFDKGHLKIKFEGETLLEYADFYTFEGDNTIDEYDVINESDMNESRLTKYSSVYDDDQQESVDDEMFELVLPSGSRIGHRSLFRYYKQSFSHRNLEQKQRSNLTIKDKYRAIAAGTAYTQVEVKKQQKDLAYFQRWRARMHAKLGWESNKLQKHFRRQDITF